METTTIQISTKLRNRLNQLKYQYGFKTIQEVIEYYIKLKNKSPQQL